MDGKKEKMLTFWSERVKLYKNDPRANTNDVWLREIEIKYVDEIIKEFTFSKIMDFGCANGYTTLRLAEVNPTISFLGIDINQDMIDAANNALQVRDFPNLSFKQGNILQDDIGEKYDFIFGIRVFQNLESPELQKLIFDALYNLLNENGRFLYIESFADGYKRMNEDRLMMGLSPLPIHPHLTLLTDDFDHYINQKMKLLKRSFPSSTYYLVTRLLYSYIAKMNDESIDYNHPIHQVAVLLPQIGDYGPQRAALFQKR